MFDACIVDPWKSYPELVPVILGPKYFLSGQHQLAPLMLITPPKRLAQSSHVNNNQKGLNE
jgi:hypothetical protein